MLNNLQTNYNQSVWEAVTSISVCHTPNSAPNPSVSVCSWEASHPAKSVEYSSRQSLKENQLSCLFLYQRFAIKRIKFPNMCGMGLLNGKSFVVRGENFGRPAASGKVPFAFLRNLMLESQEALQGHCRLHHPRGTRVSGPCCPRSHTIEQFLAVCHRPVLRL